MVAGARNKLRSTLLILYLTSLKPNPQILLNHFLIQNGFLKTHSQISDLLLKLSVLLDDLPKSTTLAQKIIKSLVLPIIVILVIEDHKLDSSFLHVIFGSQILLEATSV
jgi:hypothetical protein